MNKGIFLAILVLFFSLNAFADTTKEPSNTIPFVVNKGATQAELSGKTYQTHNTNFTISHVPTQEIQSLIMQLRSTICRNIGNGSIRVWVTVGTDGKLAAVSAFAHSG